MTQYLLVAITRRKLIAPDSAAYVLLAKKKIILGSLQRKVTEKNRLKRQQ